jgi:glutamine amidotransferase
MIAIINYGVGNLFAIQNIIQKVGGKAIITSDPNEILNADKIILPGVGAFEYGMNQLISRNLISVLNEIVIEKKKVVLGLCLGAQLMTRFSEEGNVKGLGWIDGEVVKFNQELVPTIPHMDWADVEIMHDSPIVSNILNPRFYFAHSYHFEINNEQLITGYANCGYRFPCSFQADNIFGVQFHPEKSHRFGMQLFENFIRI